ncbi:COX assembly mitochondrial protein 2 homolog isoform X4 [Trachypithecus francoisi]|uniref:COX assembly mitochondrial protein 2 homolog isoform X4 n=1 Tax=Trachypithecus francoisi TaxID=54180 RepID=UPI00141B893F|nr:COX assembly mitochondrial protein 2 homolog isoform X4 [Trachypithecus francoisi]
MRLGARGQRGWGARTAVERWRASLALGVRQAVQLSAPRQTAFGSGVSVGDCRFSSPGVAASPYIENRTKSKEDGIAMRKKLFNPPEESEQ